MGQIETSTTIKSFPEGGRIVNSIAISPVMYTRIRTVGSDQQTVELQLEQEFEPPVGSQGGILAFTMAGHSAFNTGPRRRITWQNFSVKQAVALGVIRSWEEVAQSEGPLVVGGAPQPGVLVLDGKGKELVIMRNGQKVPLKLIEVETFEGRKWISRDGKPMSQKPKQAGPNANADLLTYNGKPIYRNSGLSWPGVDDIYELMVDGKKVTAIKHWDEDLVIIHNNKVVGSTVRDAMGKAGIVVPSTPGAHAQGYQGEPTRHTPDQQVVGVAEKTQAEMQREEAARQ